MGASVAEAATSKEAQSPCTNSLLLGFHTDVLACTFADPEDARRWIREGYRMMNISSTLALGTIQTKQIFEDFR